MSAVIRSTISLVAIIVVFLRTKMSGSVFSFETGPEYDRNDCDPYDDPNGMPEEIWDPCCDALPPYEDGKSNGGSNDSC